MREGKNSSPSRAKRQDRVRVQEDVYRQPRRAPVLDAHSRSGTRLDRRAIHEAYQDAGYDLVQS